MSAQRWLSYAYADISPHPSNTKGSVQYDPLRTLVFVCCVHKSVLEIPFVSLLNQLFTHLMSTCFLVRRNNDNIFRVVILFSLGFRLVWLNMKCNCASEYGQLTVHSRLGNSWRFPLFFRSIKIVFCRVCPLYGGANRLISTPNI